MEAFTSGRDTLVRLPIGYGKPRLHFHSIDIVANSFSEQQIWLERRETRSTLKLWPILPFCSYNSK